jgi:hypothetical protein
MERIENGTDFTRILATLPLEHQHALAKRFIADVMHLSRSLRLSPLQELLNKPSCSLDDLKSAHDIARAVYVEHAPASDVSEIKFECQATHFIAQAVMTCSSVGSHSSNARHLAQKVANYCRMAQTCSSMSHEDEGPDFDQAENEYRRIVAQQYAIANEFLSSIKPDSV